MAMGSFLNFTSIIYLISLLSSITSYEITYILNYEGNTSSINAHNRQFKNAMNTSNIIMKHSNLDECVQSCTTNVNCSGYVDYFIKSKYFCNELYNTNGMEYTTLDSRSYKKIICYETVHNHSIDGVVNHIYEQGVRNHNTTVYVDLNYNGILDIGEPNVSTESYFYFDNLQPGNYLLRQEYMNNCYGILPDIFGYTEPNIDLNNYYMYYNTLNRLHIVYADIIYNYRNTRGYIIGGISNQTRGIISNLDYLIDRNNDTYITFHSGVHLNIGFSNSTIIDSIGNDIEFVLKGVRNGMNVNVSVSASNRYNLTFLGVLNETNTQFDLLDINYTSPVNNIHLTFYGNSNSEMNLSSIIGDHVIYYVPNNAIYMNVPTNSSFAFITDCDYTYDCEDYCFFVTYYWNNYY